jgi:hypothetical protein
MAPEGGSLSLGKIQPDVTSPDCARAMRNPEESGYVLLGGYPPTKANPVSLQNPRAPGPSGDVGL